MRQTHTTHTARYTVNYERWRQTELAALRIAEQHWRTLSRRAEYFELPQVGRCLRRYYDLRAADIAQVLANEAALGAL